MAKMTQEELVDEQIDRATVLSELIENRGLDGYQFLDLLDDLVYCGYILTGIDETSEDGDLASEAYFKALRTLSKSSIEHA